ncbi:hypothetical protein P43SY_007519 [Pythium insidiosum]|uniref:Transmembrane protein n=1 Tax=Pythium insidiosum TaxID=114742 RepID=A0AAD5MCE9_PYTIN|nr:hypothetical protein P43SY_007519 [Pythium insidiosum]
MTQGLSSDPCPRRRRCSRTTTLLLLLSALLLSLDGAAAAGLDFPQLYRYSCVDGRCMHIVRDDPSLFKDAVECMTKCGSAPPLDEVGDTQLSDSPDMAIGSERNGTCVNCSMVARTNFNFPKLFSAFSLSPQQLGQTATCRFKASIEIGMPMGWSFNTSTSQCFLGDVPVNCSHVDNTTVISLDANSIGGLMARPHGMFSFYIDGVSTRSNPGRFNEQTLLKMRFASQGCIPNADVNTVQAFSLELTAPSYELKGLFTNTEMEATTPRIMSTTSVSMTFESGAVLRAGSFILLRVARDLEPAFGELIRGVNNARMRHQDNDVKLKLDVGRANLSFTIPETYAVPINNGDELSITFDNFRNPANTYSMIEKGYLSAFQGLSLAVDNSLINFYKVERGCGGYLVWTIQPSKAYVYWYSAQYFFSSVMVVSLCFHWAAVLSFKAFKKLTFKSPVVLFYFIANAAKQ